jgi:4-amino-4-deoxy-L-arabinose transferase-like glycosyltransferase
MAVIDQALRERDAVGTSKDGEVYSAGLPARREVGRRAFVAGLVVVLLVAVGVRWAVFDVTDFRGDETFYLKYARALNLAGLAQFEQFAREYSNAPELWIFPPPTRALYIAVAALGCQLVQPCSGRSIAMVSLVTGVAIVAVTLVMAGRMFGPAIGLASGLLVAVSPLELQLSRRALQDGFFALMVLVTLWAFWERSRSSRRSWDVLLGAALLAALLTKESAIVLPVFLVGALAYPPWLGMARERSSLSTLSAVVLPVPAAVLVLLALIPLPLALRVLSGWQAGAWTNVYAVAYSQGPWFRYLLDFVLLSPLVVIAAIGYYFLPGRPGEDRFLGRLTLLLSIVLSVLPLMNVRYVSFLDVLLRILAVLTVVALFGDPVAHRLRRVGLVVVVLLLLAAHDLWLFHTIFVQAKVYDPVTASLAQALGLIPTPK